MDKKIKKHSSGKCHFCEEKNYVVLDVHRIIPGEKGGKYTNDNTVVCCVKHHRLVHSGSIIIYGWVDSTKGRLLHYIDENGKEQFK